MGLRLVLKAWFINHITNALNIHQTLGIVYKLVCTNYFEPLQWFIAIILPIVRMAMN